MDVIFVPPEEIYARVHAQNILPGHVFIDTDDAGNRQRVVALRSAKRLATSGKYRIYGLSVDQQTIAPFRISGDQLVEIVGFARQLTINVGPLTRHNGLDEPAGAAPAQLDQRGPFDFLGSDEHTED